MHEISGRWIISGIHDTRMDSLSPFKQAQALFEMTGKHPALFSGDFTYDNRVRGRWAMMDKVVEQWHKGALINIMWHSALPDIDEPCERSAGVQLSISDSKWNEIVTDGAPLNTAWKRRLDDIAVYLEYLQRKGVVVMFRPFHEMNQGAFWWGGRPGPNGTSRIFKLTRDYLEQRKGLKNLIWVWNVQDLSWDFEQYNPGGEYWDIITFDMYDNKSGYSKEKYDAIRMLAAGKPMAIGECGLLPTPEELENQPLWSFFLSWDDMTFTSNKSTDIKRLYNSSRVITLDQMPGWE